MSKMKKYLLTGISYALVAALAIGGTFAYLQDSDEDVNVMTLGNVQIEQHEYERATNADGSYATDTIDGRTSYVLQDFTQAKPLYPAVGNPNGGYDPIVVRMSQVGSPASSADVLPIKNAQDKFVTVENTGKTDAYIRTIVAYEAGSVNTVEALDEVIYPVEFMTAKDSSKVWTKKTVGFAEIDGNNYLVVEFIYNGAKHLGGVHENGVLPAGETSYPSLCQVYMTSAATNEDCEAIDGNSNGTYDILVLSQAVQAAGFENAKTALDTAFGKTAEKGAEWFGGVVANHADTWDGTEDTAWYNDTDTAFALSTAEEFAGFVKLVNEGNKFSQKTVELKSNIDFGGEEWTPIKKFAGTLNGNGHVVKNLEIDATAGNAGFFDVLEWATVEDLTLSNITATVGAYRFGALSRSINQTNIDNVTVKNVNVTTTASTAFVAGLFAQGTVNSNMEVNNCTVENFTVNAEDGAMIIAGITDFVQKNGTEAEGTNIFENLHVKNFKVVVKDTDGYCNVGGLVGQTQSVWQNPRFNNCSVSGLDVTATGTVNVGGFMCAPGSYTYAENCTVEGKIDVSGVTSADHYAGGFFGDYGWGDNIGKGDHKVTSCSADVDIITKYASAGGFVGSGINTEGKNKNITLTNCDAKGAITCVEGGTANIGGFAGQTDRGIYVNCSAAQNPFIGKVLDGYTLNDDGNGTLTVTK